MTQIFRPEQLAWVSFGAIGRTFEFDRRTHKRPQLRGTVVAALTLPPDAGAYLTLYAVHEADYGSDGHSDFIQMVLPYLTEWLASKAAQRGTAGSSHQQLIVEWAGAKHRFHEVKFLCRSH